MKKSSLIFFVAASLLIATAQQKPAGKKQTMKRPVETEGTASGKVIGMVFNDFFYILQEPQTADASKSTSGRYASTMRRANLGYHYSYSKDVSVRIVYDAATNVLEQGYAEVKNLIPMMDFKVGMNQTLSSEITEKIWGYRSLAPTVLDRKGWTQEFDMGLTMSGRTNAQGTSYGRLAVYNGSGLAAETDKHKKIALALGNWFNKASVAELYVDYENFPGGRSAITGKVFYGMVAKDFAFGAEAFYRMNRKFAGTKDIVPAGLSMYSWMEMMKSMRTVVRLDVVDEDLNNAGNIITNPSYREVYLNIGADYLPVPDVHVIPNLSYVKQLKKDKGSEIADYMMVRLTTAFYF